MNDCVSREENRKIELQLARRETLTPKAFTRRTQNHTFANICKEMSPLIFYARSVISHKYIKICNLIITLVRENMYLLYT